MERACLEAPALRADGLRIQGRKGFKPLRDTPFGFGCVARLVEALAGARRLGDRLPVGFLFLPDETAALPRLGFGGVFICLGAMHASFP